MRQGGQCTLTITPLSIDTSSCFREQGLSLSKVRMAKTKVIERALRTLMKKQRLVYGTSVVLVVEADDAPRFSLVE